MIVRIRLGKNPFPNRGIDGIKGYKGLVLILIPRLKHGEADIGLHLGYSASF